MGDVVVPQASFVSGEGETAGSCEVIDHCRYLGTSRGLRKMVLVDVSLVTRFLQIFDK